MHDRLSGNLSAVHSDVVALRRVYLVKHRLSFIDQVEDGLTFFLCDVKEAFRVSLGYKEHVSFVYRHPVKYRIDQFVVQYIVIYFTKDAAHPFPSPLFVLIAEFQCRSVSPERIEPVIDTSLSA